MTVVIDASVVAAALVDSGPIGSWAVTLMATEPLVAPQHMPAEVANVLRRASLSGELSSDFASIAHGQLLDMTVELVSYEMLANRIWELRTNLTTYDAWYVALAEEKGLSLATLDHRLVRAPGPRCTFLTPPA